MSSQAAIDAISEVLEKYYRGQLSPYEAMNEIARIRGTVEGERQ